MKKVLELIIIVVACSLLFWGCNNKGNSHSGGFFSSVDNFLDEYTDQLIEMNDLFDNSHGSREVQLEAQKKWQKFSEKWEEFKKDVVGKTIRTESDPSYPIKIITPFTIVFPENDGRYYHGPMVEAKVELTDDTFDNYPWVFACVDDDPISMLDEVTTYCEDQNKRIYNVAKGDIVIIRGRIVFKTVSKYFPEIRKTNKLYISSSKSEYSTINSQKIKENKTGFSR